MDFRAHCETLVYHPNAISFIMGPIFPCLAVYSFSIAENILGSVTRPPNTLTDEKYKTISTTCLPALKLPFDLCLKQGPISALSSVASVRQVYTIHAPNSRDGEIKGQNLIYRKLKV